MLLLYLYYKQGQFFRRHREFGARVRSSSFILLLYLYYKSGQFFHHQRERQSKKHRTLLAMMALKPAAPSG